MELIDALEATFEHTHAVIARVRSDQLADPTPCRDWDARAGRSCCPTTRPRSSERPPT